MAAVDQAFSAVVAAGGGAVIEVRPYGSQTWDVRQVSTELPSAPIGAACSVRKNGSQITTMVATGDVADGAPAASLHPGDRLTVEWAGCTPGDVAKALIFYDDGVPV